jgi:hypothetical protein
MRYSSDVDKNGMNERYKETGVNIGGLERGTGVSGGCSFSVMCQDSL